MGRDFKEEMNWLSRAWEEWSETEQIVALYSVARKLGAIPTRFLQILLLYNCSLESSMILIAESHANDPAWISQIPDCSEESLVELLHHFPLLRPANMEAKNLYLKLIHNVLTGTLSNSTQPLHPDHIENIRQLLSYALIHPAFSNEERRSFTKFVKYLENRYTSGSDSKDVEEYVDKEQQDILDKKDGVDNVDKYNMETSRYFELKNMQGKEGNCWLQFDDLYSHQNCVAPTSESEHSTEDNQTSSSGIKDLGVWLKSLRLHKYSSLLCNLTYDELLALDEKTLERKGVTKGARNKIIISIAKLKERPKQLKDIENEIMNGGSVMASLNQLKALVITPMPPIQDDGSENIEDSEKDDRLQPDDLSSQFVRVMGKVCTQLLVSVQPDDESVSSFLSLIDRCLSHESFTHIHAKRFLSWKQQILRLWTPLPPRVREQRHLRRWSQQYPSEVLSNNVRSARYSQRLSSWSPSFGFLAANGVYSNLHPNTTVFAFPTNLTTLMAPRSNVKGVTSMGNSPLLSPQHFLSKRPSLQETPSQLRPHVTLLRTRSAPSRPHDPSHRGRSGVTYSAGGTPSILQTSPRQKSPDLLNSQHSVSPESKVADIDITNRLESLCLSMTKHALE